MKCRKCKKPKIPKDFGFRNKKTGVRHKMCRKCKTTYNQEWYKINKDSHRKNTQKNKERYREILKAIVQEAKKGKPCMDCGDKFHPFIMDFDHIDPKNKTLDISHMVHYIVSPEKLREEILKCELVCSNCHRMRTFIQINGSPRGI